MSAARRSEHRWPKLRLHMSETNHTLRLGTRGSLLARTQSQLIASELEKHHKGVAVELVIIKTTADQILDKPLADIGGEGGVPQEKEGGLGAPGNGFSGNKVTDVSVPAR